MRDLVADIPVLFQGPVQWLTQNALWLGGLGGLAGGVYIVEKIWKPIGSITSFCWSRIKRQSKPGATLASAHLTFVAISEQCLCAIGKDGNRLITQINTHWHVTNAPESRTIVRLLAARLLKPRVDHPTARCGVLFSGFENQIVPGETCQVHIYFHADLHLQQPGKPLTEVRFAVTDQFAKEHRMPPILLPTIDTTPKG